MHLNAKGLRVSLACCCLLAGFGATGALAEVLTGPAFEAPAHCEWRHEQSKRGDYNALYCSQADKLALVIPTPGFNANTLSQARAGDPAAMIVAAIFYASVQQKSVRDPQAAVDLFRHAAEAGAPTAMFDLALAYEGGVGVAKDADLERTWLLKAAAAGSASAKLSLAKVIFKGSRATESDAEMVRLVRSVADTGRADGLFDMALLYSTGRGVAHDNAEAVRWWRLAADKHDSGAAYQLALAYCDALGVAKDDQEALRWFRFEAEPVLKAVDTMANISFLMFGENAEAIYRPKAEQGDAQAIMILAHYYHQTRPAESLRLYRFGADKGLPGAQMELAEMYAKGDGVGRDDGEAIRLFRAGGVRMHSASDPFRAVDAFEAPSTSSP